MSSDFSDFELIKEFTSGNEVAFEKLVKRYKQKIYWHARRMTGNHLDADEVAQEVLIILYRKLNTFKFDSAFTTWLFRIVSNLSINLIRKRKIKEIFSLDSSEVKRKRSENDIVKNIEEREMIQELDRIILKLPARQREVFSLRSFDELSYEEISEITGVSIGSLKATYHHAIKKINDLLKEKD